MSSTSPKREIPKTYESSTVEERIYDFWNSGGYFTPKIDKNKTPFTMIMPPPNVTGELHMGHALTIALEDLIVRWQRMQGRPTLYLPGSDHAGIATQVVVERTLSEINLSRHDIGREEFINRVWQWVDKYGARIYEQIKRLGASCDWSRASFTLNEGPSKAVRTTFVNLYKKGLIYRGERITNWCTHCRTALSDLEVRYEEQNGKLHYIRYLLDGGGDEALVIATTRPETLIGDTAVAVNPEDTRYKRYIGKKVIVPVVNRSVPIIADEAVDKEFGTGTLKVTPGHDAADFEIGQRHNLPVISIMNIDGTLNETADQFKGQSMSKVRTQIVEQLATENLLVKIEDYQHSVAHCDRSGHVVEPIVTLQWYVNMKPLAKPARDAVSDKKTQIVPERFNKIYFDWLDNIRDWCISRQLWWGHRIPVWYCESCDNIIVEYSDPESCSKCNSTNLRQDNDVLDTWFSSGLWTHSTLGWPDNTDDVNYFYPTTVMETGYDILFFWVARMMMMGIENMGAEPFETIYLHGLVLDPEGVKMSKTKGNVLDPLELIDMYGADALRFALTVGTAPGNNQRLNEQKLEASRNFANKLWNASRFVLYQLDEADIDENWHLPLTPEHRHDKWILSRLNEVTSQVQKYMEDYNFGEAQRVIHDFVWHEYADWYIEMVKIRLKDNANTPSPLPFLSYALEQILRLLHPFMPFVTEEIWQILLSQLPSIPGPKTSLMVASYPTSNKNMSNTAAEEEIDTLIEMVRSIRNLRSEFRIHQHQDIEVIIESPEIAKIAKPELNLIKSLARVSSIDFEGSIEGGVTKNDCVTLVLKSGTIRVPLAGLVNIDQEKERLTNEISDIEKNRDQLSQRLNDRKFLDRAPEDVVDREKYRLSQLEERKDRIQGILSKL